MGIKRCRKKFSTTWEKKNFRWVIPAYAKSKKLSKSMIRTFLKTNFSKNGKNVSKYITYPKISFQHTSERVLRPRKENGIQTDWLKICGFMTHKLWVMINDAISESDMASLMFNEIIIQIHTRDGAVELIK